MQNNHSVILALNVKTLLDIDKFNYLGITFYYTGKFRTAYKMLPQQALKSMFSLYNLVLSIEMNIGTKWYVFDRMILPILLYDLEVISINTIKDWNFF